MTCCRYFVVFIFAAVLPLMLHATSDDSLVMLDPYEVKSYLENYATGDSFTALRVNASLLEIPLSTSVITNGLMLDQGVTDVNSAMRNISGAQHVQGGSEFQNYYFTRGMPNFYYRDGFRMELAGGNITPNITSIENIEVLKGPSSILYGMGTPGGIVNFNSKRPLFQNSQSWQVTAGSNSHVRGDLDITGSATEQFAYRLIGSWDDAKSYRDSVSNTTTYLNPSAIVKIGTNSQLFVMIDYAKQELVPDGGIPTRPDGSLPVWATNATNVSTSFNTTTPRTTLVDYASTRYLAELSIKVRPNYEFRVVASQMNFDHKGSEMANNMLDSAASGVPGFLGPDQLLRVWNSKYGTREVSVLRVENLLDWDHQLGSAQLEHQLLFSLEYGETDTDMTTSMQDHEIVDFNTRLATPVWQYFSPFLGTTKDGQLIYDRGTDGSTHRETSFAIQDNIRLSESWRLLLGLRYEENHAELKSDRENFVIGSTPAPIETHIRSEATEGRLLPRVGLLFLARPQIALFFNYLTSFIPAGPTQIGKNGLIPPETGDQFETGVKYELVPNRLFATASVFKIRRKAIATFYQDLTTFATYWKASDTEESSGFEMELTGTVAKGLNLVGHFGYLDNKVTGTDVIRKIDRRRHALSKVTASLWATYAVQTESFKGLRLGFGAFHSGPQYLEDYNTIEIAGRTLCDAMIGYVHNRWSAQLNIHNLFDHHYYFPAGNGYNDPAYSAANYNSSVQTLIPGSGLSADLRLSYAF